MLNTIAGAKELAEIHQKTLWLLYKVGIKFEEQEALELFRHHGFQVEAPWVYFTEQQVTQALAACPKQFSLDSLTGPVHFGDGGVALAGASGALSLYDQGSYRQARVEDLIHRHRLDSQSAMHDMADAELFYCPEIPQEKEVTYKTALALKYNPKPLIGYCSNYQASAQSLQIVQEFYDRSDNYTVLGVGNVVSPLTYTAENIGAMTAYGRFRQPLCITCCSIPGMTSPVTLSGTLVQNNAEILAGLVYMQLLTPGIPLVYGNSSMGVDMRSGNAASGAFETSLLIPYTAALAKYYGLPGRASGSLTDAKANDYQAGMESAVGLLYALNCDIDFIYHSAGGLDGLAVFSFAKYLLDEELLTRLFHAGRRDMLRGLEVSLADIEKMKDSGFLSCKQTAKEYKREHYTPQLANRQRMAKWQKEGAPSLEDLAQQVLSERLAAYQSAALAPEQERYLQRILDAPLLGGQAPEVIG